MTEDQEKTLERLVETIEGTYASPRRVFLRGLLWGLGRGIGNLIGFLLLLAVLFYLFKLSGLQETFRKTYQDFQRFSETVKSATPR